MDNVPRRERVQEERVQEHWLPAGGPVRIGLTAGASTPNSKIGGAVMRIFAMRGLDAASVLRA